MAGIVENMSGLVCPHCGAHIDLFNRGGGQATAGRMGIRFLGELPIEPRVVQESDKGVIEILSDETNEYTRKFSHMVDELIELTRSGLKRDPHPTIAESNEPDVGVTIQ